MIHETKIIMNELVKGTVLTFLYKTITFLLLEKH